jgi:hypothetical protein
VVTIVPFTGNAQTEIDFTIGKDYHGLRGFIADCADEHNTDGEDGYMADLTDDDL